MKSRLASTSFSAGLALLAALALAGCSKNDAASKACASVSGGDACSACCTANGATGYKFSSGSSCDCLGGDGKKAAAPAPAPAPAAGAVVFAGTYRSTWGTTVFAQTGNVVTATYPNGGNMSCTPSGNVLDCSWKESVGSGKASLTKNADGTISGTWGNGASATNGGPWVFTP